MNTRVTHRWWLAFFSLLALASAACGKGESACGDETGDRSDGETREAKEPRVRSSAYLLDLETGRMDVALTLSLPAPADCVTVQSARPPDGPTSWQGKPARVTHDGKLLRVCGCRVPAGDLRIATRVQLESFRGEQVPEVGYYQVTDAGGYVATELVSWLQGCTLFGPCDPSVAQQTELDITVQHRSGMTVLCPGTRTTTSAISTHCHLDSAPLYSGLTVVAHPALVRRDWFTEGSTRVVLFEAPQGVLGAALDAASIQGGMRFLTGLLGPFPYGEELRVAGVPLGWLGFEPPANLLISDQVPSLPPRDYARPAQHTVLHELVHQWAGDRTTLAEARDVVWKEAIAEYLTYLMEEDSGWPGEAATSRGGWQRAGRFASWWPLDQDPSTPPFVLASNAYSAGTMALFVQLEPLLGRDVLLRAIQRFLTSEVASTAQLRAALEAEAGISLERYWFAWVEGTGEPPRPVLRAEADAEKVRVTQLQAEGPFPCVVDLELVGATRSARVEARFDLENPTAQVEVANTLGEPVQQVVVDPDNRLLWWTAL